MKDGKLDAATREDRKGDWMQTYTGRKFWPLDPRAEEVDIADIAHALANQCRFAGHCRTFYSVAEHSVRVSWLAGDDAALALVGLLHDAAEAYVVDVPRPLKRFLPGYATIENGVLVAIMARFGLDVAATVHRLERVKHFDEVMLATEARDLMGGESAGKWTLHAEPIEQVIVPWGPGAAERFFLTRFEALRQP